MSNDTSRLTGSTLPDEEDFEQPVVLQQTGLWSHMILWGLMTTVVGLVTWAAYAPMEQAVQVRGELKPLEQVKEVRVPLTGVVQNVYVKDGDVVKKGQVLFTLDPRVNQADLQANKRVRDTLVAENRINRALLSGDLSLSNLSEEEQATLSESYRAFETKVFSLKERIRQFEDQLRQNNTMLESNKKVLALNYKLLSDLQGLVEVGGLSRVEYIRLQQEVFNKEAEVKRLQEEQPRLLSSIRQATEEMNNAIATTRRDLLLRINENERRISELNRELQQADIARQYQEVRAPESGIIFELQSHTPGFVASANDLRPIVKIVPNNYLLAEVFINNKDIGFVEVGMPADVRIDSFPFSEFGDVKGKLVWIGADALPPTPPTYDFFRFPARIELSSQTMQIRDRIVPLQSGMSVTANIRTRNRTVLSIFTDLFTRQAESLRYVR
jgi:HlyD family secretion protein